MTPQIIALINAIFVAVVYIWYLNRQRLKYRKLWIQAADKLNEIPGGVMLQLSIAKQSAKHWNHRMHHLEDENTDLRKKIARGQQELTRALETIDGLLHGDAQCCAGHRFYSPFDKCPHCGAPKLDDLPTEPQLSTDINDEILF